MKCYKCDTETTLGESDEHIIIKAAGGRLKSKELICRKCNSYFGHTIDSPLAKQLNSWTNLLIIKRDDGKKPQPIIGKKYILEADGKRKLAKPIIGKTGISVKARSRKELKKNLHGLVKKRLHLGEEEAMKYEKEAMKSAQWRTEYFAETLHLQDKIGGNEVFRAVCKCAINFFIYSKGNASQIKHLIPYIKGEEMKEVVWMHYQENLYELKPEESSHIIHLVGKQDEGILYCYVDYFNTHKYLVLLNDNYQGQDIKKTYFFDLINVSPIQREVTIDYDKKTLLGFFNNKDANQFENVKKAFAHSITLASKRQDDRQASELIKKIVQSSLGKYPKDIPITMLGKIFEEVSKNVAASPHLVRLMKI